MSWSSTLARPIRPRDGAPLRTLGNARAYLLSLPEGEAVRPAWQTAAALVLAAAESGDRAAVLAATDQIERALFVAYRLDMTG
ncbi:hypothetical protein [Rhodoplanes sp. SY1]|uniref:hypothetical protein n=1 Tax=Rhodoplanes sp. SY1 TaxID=3166646 RepID=UPI0038B567D7